MSNTVIKVENLCKLYRLGELHTRTNSLRDKVTSFFKKDGNTKKIETIWALKDISFEIDKGEAIGIIGRNGAGKSTLLKILSRITKPTTGKARINGRTGSLLEVGTGFHPELTGRENIYLNGAILGMYKKEISRKFDEIVAFAEIEKFIDTPVKRYSSGMYVRLAFAVAAHLEPEILLVDEVLAVGDFAFQKKCLEKMEDVTDKGKTVLFVSHNLTAVRNLCKRTLFMDCGRKVDFGDTPGIITKYIGQVLSTKTCRIWNDMKQAPGTDEVRLHSISIQPKNGTPEDAIDITNTFFIEIKYWNLKQNNYLNPSVTLTTEDNATVFITTPLTEKEWHGRPFPRGLFRSEFCVPGNLLNNGRYRISVLFVKNQQKWIFREQDILVFDVHESFKRQSAYYGKRLGVIRPVLEWTTELLNELIE